jgi:hypothetical protein
MASATGSPCSSWKSVAPSERVSMLTRPCSADGG